MRPLVLLSNDDGYAAAGLQSLRRELLRHFDVLVCAPHTEQSSMSHSISLNRPLRLYEHDPGMFSVDGTPADCVYVALVAGQRLLPRPPALVVSGLNHGLNLGNDVFYSGTVAAAREGALRGIPSIAASATARTDYASAGALIARLGLALLGAPVADTPLLLNVNFPPGDSWPVRATRLGTRTYQDVVDFRRDPRGGEYLWLGGGGVSNCATEGTDTQAQDVGVVSCTPLSLELYDAKSAQQTASLSAQAEHWRGE